MRDPERIDKMLNLIKSIWKTYPDFRLTQLITNAIPFSGDIFYVEDDALFAYLKSLQKKLKEDNHEYNQSTVRNP